jgi:hypothetical protein
VAYVGTGGGVVGRVTTLGSGVGCRGTLGAIGVSGVGVGCTGSGSKPGGGRSGAAVV